jgi:hypothetical protein
MLITLFSLLYSHTIIDATCKIFFLLIYLVGKLCKRKMPIRLCIDGKRINSLEVLKKIIDSLQKSRINMKIWQWEL